MFAASAFVGAPVVSARVVSAPRATRAPRTVALFGFGEKKEEPKKKTIFGTISGSKSGTKVTTRSGTKSGTKVVTKSSAKKGEKGKKDWGAWFMNKVIRDSAVIGAGYENDLKSGQYRKGGKKK
uniref:Uncharacterized protein n=1 Tax=Mantoniella antarctica TaxID=81844 RepID=A0A7S0SDE1_9CHLO